MTAVKINEIAYSATDPMARTARIVNAVISLLDRARPEGGASVDAFSGAVSVVFVDIQNHSLVGNDLNACFSFSSCRRLLPSVFVSASLLHVPLFVPPVLLQENRDPRSRSTPHGAGSRAGSRLYRYCSGQARSQ